MRKGQRVRILRTNELGTIAEKQLIRKGGEVKTYCRVRLDKSPELDTWFFANQLGKTKEVAFVTFLNQTDKKIVVGVEIDHERGCISKLKVAGTPDNPEQHQGFYQELASTFIHALDKCRPCTTKEQ